MNFTLGQSVIISRREWSHESFTPWREGTVTAVGDQAVRVRTITRWPWGKVLWVHLHHTLWQITSIQE